MITPSFSLDFSSAVLDPAVTFARVGATATRINSSGYVESVAADTARFDFNPLTLSCRGLLIEEARSNVLTYSQDFNNAVWTKLAGTVSSSVGISPDGTNNAQKLVDGATAGTLRRGIATTAQPYAYSVFAKKDDRDQLYLANSYGEASFNLTTGVATKISGPGSFSAFISPFKDGWYRCGVVFTATAATPNFFVATYGSQPIVNGVSGVLIYGGQLEAGAFPTSYIPNIATGSTTRNADVATITGTNFSDFWQASKGGAQVQAIPSTVSGIRPLVQYDDGTANEIIALRGNTTNPELYIVDGGTPQAQLDAGTIAANTAYSLTGWWATNDCKARKDSGAVVTDDTATIPTVTQARLGSDGTNYLNGHLATVNYYDTFSGQIYTRRKNKVIFNLM